MLYRSFLRLLKRGVMQTVIAGIIFLLVWGAFLTFPGTREPIRDKLTQSTDIHTVYSYGVETFKWIIKGVQAKWKS